MINLKSMVNETMNSVMPLTKSSDLEIVPCAYSTEGTALKPAIEYDPLSKANIGLNFPVSVDYVKRNTLPDRKQLEQEIIHEVVVDCITSLDNVTSLPLSIEYCTKSGKTGEDVYKITKDHIRQLQVCYSCPEKSKSDKRIVHNFSSCNSYCEACYALKSVCTDCQLGTIH